MKIVLTVEFCELLLLLLVSELFDAFESLFISAFLSLLEVLESLEESVSFESVFLFESEEPSLLSVAGVSSAFLEEFTLSVVEVYVFAVSVLESLLKIHIPVTIKTKATKITGTNIFLDFIK